MIIVVTGPTGVGKTKLSIELAKKFNAVSVREKSGIALCKEHLDVEAVLVLDPTLLLPKKWTKLKIYLR